VTVFPIAAGERSVLEQTASRSSGVDLGEGQGMGVLVGPMVSPDVMSSKRRDDDVAGHAGGRLAGQDAGKLDHLGDLAAYAIAPLLQMT